MDGWMNGWIYVCIYVDNAGIHDMVAALNEQTGWDVPLHVDAVS